MLKTVPCVPLIGMAGLIPDYAARVYVAHPVK